MWTKEKSTKGMKPHRRGVYEALLLRQTEGPGECFPCASKRLPKKQPLGKKDIFQTNSSVFSGA